MAKHKDPSKDPYRDLANQLQIQYIAYDVTFSPFILLQYTIRRLDVNLEVIYHKVTQKKSVPIRFRSTF